MKMKKAGFTLVELIVVIVILSILSTLWFVAYTDYLQWVRDGNRIQQMTEIHKALTIYSSRTRLPLPEDAISIVAWNNNVWIQWYANQSVLDTVKFTDGWVDPKTGKFFTYFMSNDRKYAQILWFFEENNTSEMLALSKDTFADELVVYSTLFPLVHGAKLWILVQDETNIPIQDVLDENIDLLTNTENYVSYFDNEDSVVWSWEVLYGMVPNTSCSKLISDIPWLESWEYKINPSWNQSVDVYCEMDESSKWYWKWWTLLARTHPLWSWRFGWLQSQWSIFVDSNAYSLWLAVKDIRFKEIMMATYDTGKNITAAMTMDIDDVFFQQAIQFPEWELDTQVSQTSKCSTVYNAAGYDESCYRNDNPNHISLRYWWAFWNESAYVFNRQNTSEEGFIFANEMQTNNNSLDNEWTGLDNFRWEQWMIFVR